MFEELFKNAVKIFTEPVQIIFLLFIAFLVRELYKQQGIINKLLQAQQDRGIVLTKIVTMVEAIFQDSRRSK